MPTTFRNAANGHKETVGDGVWAGPLFLGAIYLAYKGLWTHFVIWILVVFSASAIGGLSGLIVAILAASVVYAIVIKGILESSYLRRGWIKSGVDDPVTMQELSERQCPFCAETIKKEAVKCKHCGAELEKDMGSHVRIVTDGWAVRVECWSEDQLSEAYEKIKELECPAVVADGLVAVGGLFTEKSDAEALRRNLSSRYRIESIIRYQSPS
ncbi:hypothetical protein [Pseudomonas amygdali]|uniref:hypothetical protein n=1 Tax=Pseudomonas amygdali TaxID=47877 RepID=UPI00353257B2